MLIIGPEGADTDKKEITREIVPIMPIAALTWSKASPVSPDSERVFSFTGGVISNVIDDGMLLKLSVEMFLWRLMFQWEILGDIVTLFFANFVMFINR